MNPHTHHFRDFTCRVRERRLVFFADEAPRLRTDTPPIDPRAELRRLEEAIGHKPQDVAGKGRELWADLQTPAAADVRTLIGADLAVLERLCANVPTEMRNASPVLQRRFRILQPLHAEILLNLHVLLHQHKNPHRNADAHRHILDLIVQRLQGDLRRYAPISETYEVYAKGLLQESTLSPDRLQYFLQHEPPKPRQGADDALVRQHETVVALWKALKDAVATGTNIPLALDAYRIAFTAYNQRLTLDGALALGNFTPEQTVQLRESLSLAPKALREDVDPAVRARFAALPADWTAFNALVESLNTAGNPERARPIVDDVKTRLPDIHRRVQEYRTACRELGGRRLKNKIGLEALTDAQYPLFLQDIGRPIREPQAAEIPDPQKLAGLRRVHAGVERDRTALLATLDTESELLVQEGTLPAEQHYEHVREGIVKYLSDRELFEINIRGEDNHKPNLYLMMMGTMVEIRAAMAMDKRLLTITRGLTLDKINELLKAGTDVQEFLRSRGVRNPPTNAKIMADLYSSPKKMVMYTDMIKMGVPPSILVFYAMHIANSENKLRATAEFTLGVLAFMKTEQAIAWSSKALAGSESTAVARALRVPGHPAVKMALAMIVMYHGEEIIKKVDKVLESILPDSPWQDWAGDNALGWLDWVGQKVTNEVPRLLGLDYVDPYRDMDSYMGETIGGEYTHTIGDWNRRASQAVANEKNPVKKNLGALSILETRQDRERYAKVQSVELYMNVSRLVDLQGAVNRSLTERSLGWTVDIAGVATADSGGRQNRNDRELGYYLMGTCLSGNFSGGPDDAFKAKRYFEQMKEKKEKSPADAALLSSWEEYVTLGKRVAQKVSLLKHMRYDDADPATPMYRRDAWLGESWRTPQGNANELGALPAFVQEGLKEKIAHEMRKQEAVSYQPDSGRTPQQYSADLVNAIQQMKEKFSFGAFVTFLSDRRAAWAQDATKQMQRMELWALSRSAQMAAQMLPEAELDAILRDVRALVIDKDSPSVEDIRAANAIINTRLAGITPGAYVIADAATRADLKIGPSTLCILKGVSRMVDDTGEHLPFRSLSTSRNLKGYEPSVVLFEGNGDSFRMTRIFCSGNRDQWTVQVDAMQYVRPFGKGPEDPNSGGRIRLSIRNFPASQMSFTDWSRANPSQAGILGRQFMANELRAERAQAFNARLDGDVADYTRRLVERYANTVIVLGRMPPPAPGVGPQMPQGRDAPPRFQTVSLPMLFAMARSRYVTSRRTNPRTLPINRPIQPLRPPGYVDNTPQMRAAGPQRGGSGGNAPARQPELTDEDFGKEFDEAAVKFFTADGETLSPATYATLLMMAGFQVKLGQLPPANGVETNEAQMRRMMEAMELVGLDGTVQKILTVEQYLEKNKDTLSPTDRYDLTASARTSLSFGDRSGARDAVYIGLAKAFEAPIHAYRQRRRAEIRAELDAAPGLPILEMSVASGNAWLDAAMRSVNGVSLPTVTGTMTPQQRRMLTRWDDIRFESALLLRDIAALKTELAASSGPAIYERIDAIGPRIDRWKKSVDDMKSEDTHIQSVLSEARSITDSMSDMGLYQQDRLDLRDFARNALSGSTHKPLLFARGMRLSELEGIRDTDVMKALVQQVRDMSSMSEGEDRIRYAFDRVGWIFCAVKTDSRGNRHYCVTATFNSSVLGGRGTNAFHVQCAAVIPKDAGGATFGVPVRVEGMPAMGSKEFDFDGRRVNLPSPDDFARQMLRDREQIVEDETRYGRESRGASIARIVTTRGTMEVPTDEGQQPVFGMDLGNGKVLLIREVAPGQWQHRIADTRPRVNPNANGRGPAGGPPPPVQEYTPFTDPELRRRIGDDMIRNMGGIEGGQWADTGMLMTQYSQNFGRVPALNITENDTIAWAVSRFMTGKNASAKDQNNPGESARRTASLTTMGHRSAFGPGGADDFQKMLQETLQRLDMQGVSPTDRQRLVSDVQSRLFDRQQTVQRGGQPMTTPELMALKQGLDGLQVNGGTLERGSIEGMIPSGYTTNMTMRRANGLLPPSNLDR